MSESSVVRGPSVTTAPQAPESLTGAVARLLRMASGDDFTVLEVLRELFLVAVRALGVDAAGVRLAGGGNLWFCHTGPGSLVAEEPFPQGRDVRADPLPESVEGRSSAGLRSMAMPLLACGRSLGVLDLYRSTTRGWTGNDLAVARSFSHVAASSIAFAVERDRARIAPAPASHDELTALPRRGALFDRLEQGVLTAARDRRPAAVVFVDFDGLEDIQNTLGHTFGDLVLAEVARRMRLTSRANDTLGWRSGDEFVVIREDLTGSPAQVAQWLQTLGRRIQLALRDSPDAAKIEVVVSVSVGVAVTTHRRSAENLLDHPDRMHRDTQRGSGRLVVGRPAVVPFVRRDPARERPRGE